MNILHKNIVESLLENVSISLPLAHQYTLPEKVLQFGTGVLLRGLPDYYIDQANRNGTYSGRVVVVKTTANGSLLPYKDQNCLYTVCMRGRIRERLIDHAYINASISRVLNAQEDWEAIREFAISPLLELIISNTTEVGIVLHQENIEVGIPISYPGKLLNLLYYRWIHFQGDAKKGLVILPAELIENNGDKLRDILIQLIAFNRLSDEFLEWFNKAVIICNTLVDRIVPGKMPDNVQKKKERELGFIDQLMISCEPFGLWVIESKDERVKRIVGFTDDANGCKVVPSIHKYKELKLRMLNATHTFSCALSMLAGISLVRESISHEQLSQFFAALLLEEIKDAIISDEISEDEAIKFGNTVLDRFANPFLDHKWESIASQYALKLQVRCIPLIFSYYHKKNSLPLNMLKGVAAYLVWSDTPYEKLDELMADLNIWGRDLTTIPGLNDQLKIFVKNISNGRLL